MRGQMPQQTDRAHFLGLILSHSQLVLTDSYQVAQGGRLVGFQKAHAGGLRTDIGLGEIPLAAPLDGRFELAKVGGQPGMASAVVGQAEHQRQS